MRVNMLMPPRVRRDAADLWRARKRPFENRALILRSRTAASRRMLQEVTETSGASFETPFLAERLLRMRAG
jgi:hypothetical protein